ncbi:hypothetical protein F0P96_13050 [Hymenobacter busanensis]|uniref:Uncharacterized protein n=1 Tax=Hymenobacter busanensis TaxID=2607656 RepID=A0A7L4ZVN6_9BACT|nr:hypothetical protein [Hymenobacter busanensis]KAA9332395.1 hypothetical protein F0P96_13050 [Hymenobacter busanensis]QHJ07268.1 hypothetical protein GUY19_08225 [Hymenobacter busanensis]
MASFAELIIWLDRVSTLSIALPLVVGLVRRRQLSAPSRPLMWYCILWAILHPLELACRKLFHYNIFLFHLCTPLETGLLAAAYYRALPQPRLRQLVRWVAGPFLLLCLADAVWLSGLWKINAYARAVQSALLVSLGLAYFWQMLRELRVVRPEHDPMFLTSVGMILYFTGTVGAYTLTATTTEPQVILLLQLAHGVCNTAFNLLLAAAFWYDGRQVRRQLVVRREYVARFSGE